MVVWVNYKCVRKFYVHKTRASGIQNKVALLKQCENGLHPILLLVLHQQKRYLFSWNGNACTMGHFERTCLSFSSFGSLLLEEAWQWHRSILWQAIPIFSRDQESPQMLVTITCNRVSNNHFYWSLALASAFWVSPSCGKVHVRLIPFAEFSVNLQIG